MLKIEIMKFQAQDIITSSIPTPNTGKAECTCTENDVHFSYPQQGLTSWNHQGCKFEGRDEDHKCVDPYRPS